MGKNYNVCFRKVTEKKETYFVEIGAGFILTDGKGRIDVVLDSIPVNWDGRITLFPLNAYTKEVKNG